MTTAQAPLPKLMFGTAYAGYKLFTYAAGTTTKSTTYTDSTGVTPNTNPIILDSQGNCGCWLSPGVAIKFTLAPPTDTDPPQNPVWTVDNVIGIGVQPASEWVGVGATPVYVDGTHFTVPGNFTSTFQVNRRVQASVQAGTIYGTITASSYSSPNTMVTVAWDSGQLDSGLSTVNVGFLNSNNSSVPGTFLRTGTPLSGILQLGKSAPIAAAATTDLSTATGNEAHITGSGGPITSFGTLPAGTEMALIYDSTPTINNSANIIIPGGANITAAAGDVWKVVSEGSGVWRVTLIQLASGLALVSPSAASVQGTFKNLQASASGTGSNISVSIDEIALENASNGYITLRSVSLTIASNGSGANGLDTGTLAASTQYFVWVISKPDGTTAGLISLSSTAPTMPTGYTFKARVGAIFTDGTGNKYPLSFKQFNRQVVYAPGSTLNITGFRLCASGANGSISTPTFVAVGLSTYIPSTACKVKLLVCSGGVALMVAPNNNAGWSAYNSYANPVPVVLNGTQATSVPYEMSLESQNIYVATQSGSEVFVMGWEDNL